MSSPLFSREEEIDSEGLSGVVERLEGTLLVGLPTNDDRKNEPNYIPSLSGIFCGADFFH